MLRVKYVHNNKTTIMARDDRLIEFRIFVNLPL